MPKRKTTPETELSAAPATESAANAPRKRATTPKQATTTAAHRHVRKTAKTVEVAIEAPVTEIVPSTSAPSHKPSRAVTHGDIARLAYSYWEARGHQGGSPHEDWLRAERELIQID